jgi:hypothetical protein
MAQIPANSVILQTGGGANLLSWPIIPAGSPYTVQKSTDGVNFSTLATPVGNSYLDSSVLIGTQYWYTVAPTGGAATPSTPASIVPCVVGQINLGYLRYQAQLAADMINANFVTVDAWNFYLNQSACELYDCLVTHYGENYFLAPPLLIPLTGLPSYPLPNGANYPIAGIPSPGFYKISGVDANVSGASAGINAGWTPLSRFNWSDRDRFTIFGSQMANLGGLSRMSYRVMGGNLFILPQNSNQLVQVWYVPMLPPMLNDTDMLSFSLSGWSEFVIVDAAIKALIKEESLEQAEALSARKSALLERIEVAATARDVDQPNTISNVRATMSDPGFSSWGQGGFGGGFGGLGGGF